MTADIDRVVVHTSPQPENIVLVRPHHLKIMPGERIVVKLVDLGFTRHRRVDGLSTYRATEVRFRERHASDMMSFRC